MKTQQLTASEKLLIRMHFEKLVFDDGIFLTAQITEAVALIYSVDDTLAKKGGGQANIKITLSTQVVITGFEPVSAELQP